MTIKPKLCKACDGTVWHYGDCMRCEGKGVVTKPKRGQPKRVRKMVCIKMHPDITDRLNSAVQDGSIKVTKSRFIELAICDKLGMKHPDIKK